MAEVTLDTADPKGPGTRLSKARSDAGYTVEEVAQRLRLSPYIVRRLEADDYDDSIPDAFARGYLRNYAKVVELDPQQIMASYSQLIGSTKVKNYYEPSATLQDSQESAWDPGLILPLIVVGVIILIAVSWFFMSAEKASPPPSSEPSGVASQSQTGAKEVKLNADLQSLQQGAVKTDINLSDGVVSAANATPDEVPLLTEIPQGFVETPDATLEFEFVDDCWVQVIDANGEVLAVGLKNSGRTFEVSGLAPIAVVLGKPRAVNIKYNQENVDLSCFPAPSTARFELSNPLACGN